MKILTSSQRQLLKVLQIAPLELKPAFIAESVTRNQAETDVVAASESLSTAELTSALAQDICLALPDGFSWHIDPHSLSVSLKDKLIITPALPQLRQAEIKRALWQILGTLDEN